MVLQAQAVQLVTRHLEACAKMPCRAATRPFCYALSAAKAVLRGDLVMVEQLLFFDISPDLTCSLVAGLADFKEVQRPPDHSKGSMQSAETHFGSSLPAVALLVPGSGKVFVSGETELLGRTRTV